jgi:glycosyltransferase involved in cell wall biosynthesis
MRICYVSHSTSHFTQPYVDYFTKRGHEVHLLSFLGQGLPGAINHRPPGGDVRPATRKLAYLRALPGVRRTLEALEPCVLHAHYVSSNGVLAAYSGVHPLVLSARGSDLHHVWNPIKRAALKYALRRADLVNPVSRAFEGTLAALGTPPARMLTLTHGVESSRFLIDRSRRSPGTIRITCTRNLRPHYNGLRIVQALAILSRRGVPFQFTFAAGGAQEGALRRAVADLGLARRVAFLGGYEQADLPSILASADIYVSASRSDGSSVSLLEAMASGAFPVVSDVAGNREWLTGQGDSLLFDPEDPNRLAERLRAAIEDDELRDRAVAVNRRTIAARGEREKNLADLAEVYRELLERKAATHEPRLSCNERR